MMGVPAEETAKNLRLSKADASRLSKTLLAISDDAPAKLAGWQYGADIARDAVLIRIAGGQALAPNWEAEVEFGAAQVLPVTAKDLIASGANPGPDLGRDLRALEAKWAASDFTLTQTELMAFWQSSR